MSAFDHVPVVTMTEWGPSIHNDEVATDNEILRGSGVVDVRWHDGALQVVIDATSIVRGILTLLAQEISGPNGQTVTKALKDLAWVSSPLNHDDEIAQHEYTDALDHLHDVLDIPRRLDAVATLQGPAAVLLGERVMSETPEPAHTARAAILVHRARSIDA